MGSAALSAEVVCSVVFGIIATLLAVVGIIQNCLRKRVKGMPHRAAGRRQPTHFFVIHRTRPRAAPVMVWTHTARPTPNEGPDFPLGNRMAPPPAAAHTRDVGGLVPCIYARAAPSARGWTCHREIMDMVGQSIQK